MNKTERSAWWHRRSHLSRERLAVELAAAEPFPPDERLFIRTHPLLDEFSHRLRLGTERAHAFVVALTTLPEADREAFAAGYLQRPRHGLWWDGTEQERLSAAALVALLVAPLAARPEVRSERMLDLLTGAAQGDDLSQAPETTLDEVRKVVAHVRLDLELEDPFQPGAAAATAIVEVLDPSSGEVALQEVLVRATWAAAQSWPRDGLLAFLFAVDECFARASRHHGAAA